MMNVCTYAWSLNIQEIICNIYNTYVNLNFVPFSPSRCFNLLGALLKCNHYDKPILLLVNLHSNLTGAVKK